MIGSYERAAELLSAAESVCVVTHVRPDADAIGSAAALTMALTGLGTKVRAFVGQTAAIPENLRTIPGAELVELSDTLPQECDLIVTVDCGSVERTGLLAQAIIDRREKVLVLDHHASNEGFGADNLVDTVESTTLVLYELFALINAPISEPMAHALYAGLMTDTGSFRWGSPRMHRVAAEFMEFGLDTKQIAADLLDHVTVDDLHFFGRALSGLQIRRAGDHTVAILIADHESTTVASQSAVETLVDFVRTLEGTTLGAVFKEQKPGTWAVSLRSNQADVSRIAGVLGGGGHVPAAGYTTYGTREDAVLQLLATLRGAE
ncbi:DHH family phosphoesterase [Corynebacterium uterequi]|uniref:Exopolyphosphatase-like enzyme n=1 Tax=Corynebacterium uterequi TaxID=1072256 RepID=A0A0G3HJM7_9CORY|nr:bifunctional oligoribonuclease/PAP phosphatase NrnA [Corynebacterium uterequi]AKK11327.1 exopolyphosphatase-like enzyme [Corynebacterium uterequi]